MEELEDLLIQVRRIEQHRVAGAEKQIQKAYQEVLKELQHYLADEYVTLAEQDKLTYAMIQQKSSYANFLEQVQKRVNSITPQMSMIIKNTVQDTYKATYESMIEAVEKTGVLSNNLKGIKACTPETIKRVVNNPISGLTLQDRLEKNRKDIIYNIKQEIGVGLTNGDRYTTMAKRIEKSLEGDYEKAIRIARTETHRVRESGNLDASIETNQALYKAGKQMMKTWKTMCDIRVRGGEGKKRKRRKRKIGKSNTYNHVKMEGVQIPVDQLFLLPSGYTTMSPGSSGVAGEDIHCRCYLSYDIIQL